MANRPGGARRPDVAVYELPVLACAPGRSPVDTDVGKAVRGPGLSGTGTIGVLLVDRSGRNEKTLRLTAALERPSADA